MTSYVHPVYGAQFQAGTMYAWQEKRWTWDLGPGEILVTRIFAAVSPETGMVSPHGSSPGERSMAALLSTWSPGKGGSLLFIVL